MYHIKKLDSTLSHQICAEQVATDLKSIVKELIDNSLDAQAKSINIRIRNFGLDSVEVWDNGTGILPDDFQKLARRGATSKISSIEDIYTTLSYGYRGEALSSIKSVSHLIITTKHSSSIQASKLIFSSSGEIQSITTATRETGTTVLLENLYYNLPIRQQEFDKRRQYHLSSALNLLQGYSFFNRDVRFTFSHIKDSNEDILMTAITSKSLLDKCMQILGLDAIKYIIEIRHEEEQYCITGVVSNPQIPIKKAYSYVSINRRLVNTPPQIKRAISSAYKEYSQSKYMFIIEFKIKQEWLDSNLSPDKMDVILQQESRLAEDVRNILTNKFKEAMESNSLGSSKRQLELSPVMQNKKMKLEIVRPREKEKGISLEDRNRTDTENIELNIDRKETQEEKKDSILSIDQFKVLSTPVMKIYPSISINSSHPNPPKLISNQPQIDSYITSEPKPSLLKNQTQIFSPLPVDPKIQLLHGLEVPKILSNLPSDPKVSLLQTPPAYNPSPSLLSLSKSSRFSSKGTLSSAQLNWSLSQIGSSSNPSPKKFDLVFDHSASVHNLSSETDLSCLNSQFKKVYFKDLRIIGQFNRGFILAYLSASKDLFIIDQHAADEKYLFETLQHNTTIHKQPLICPHKLRLTVSEELIALDNLKACEMNGFIIKTDMSNIPGERLYLNTLPFSKDTVFSIDDALEMLRTLPQYSYISNQQHIARLSRPAKFRSLFASRACRKAVMIGDALEYSHMKRIVERLSELEHPWSCPHGRPTLRHLINTEKVNR